MNKALIYKVGLILFFMMIFRIGYSASFAADTHPRLVITPEVIREIKKNKDNYKLLKSSVQDVLELADKAMQQNIVVPFPKDPAGGFTHEKHKQNAIDMKNLALAYQLTGEKKYAIRVDDMLKKYAELYPTLGIHPEHRNNWPGKLFWQGLNEVVWMVDVVQAYDAVYETLTKNEREAIEQQLLRKVVDFVFEYRGEAFDLMHNHGTWAIAAVGMTGIVLNDDSLLDMAIYGYNKDGKTGFLKQLDTLFSPTGYYEEGPYYQRYAMAPFMIFAQVLEYNRPGIHIMQYRDNILLKATETLMQLTDESGAFFPINDALKAKDYKSGELVPALDIAYLYSHNNDYLDIARLQKKVEISEAGLEMAKALDKGKVGPFERKSLFVADGTDGTKGGLGIMRQGNGHPAVIFKFASQGMGHGHFDRLSFMFYDQGKEILSDYGAARFVNVATKDGGRYLTENKSWAKQTIAHNTMVVNEKSDFDLKLPKAEEHAPKLLFYDISNPDFQVFSAVDSFCYEPAVLHRTMVLTKVGNQPVVLDVFNCTSKAESNTYDYALYYKGQPTSFSFELTPSLTEKKAMGTKNGYQHLWVDAVSNDFADPQHVSFTFLEDQRFYTVSTVVDEHSKIYFTQLGANDPNFNLRNERGLIVRNTDRQNQLSFTAIQQHGRYNSSQEYSRGSEPDIQNMAIVYQDEEKAAFQYQSEKHSVILLLCLDPSKVDEEKVINLEGKKLSWNGWYSYVTD